MAYYTRRFWQTLKTYGKVGIRLHLSVSAVSILGFYVAIENNVDVVGHLHKIGLGGEKVNKPPQIPEDIPELVAEPPSASSSPPPKKPIYPIAETRADALLLAVVCNKALFPIRLPITIVFTPPIARFLARRSLTTRAKGFNLFKKGIQHHCGNCGQLGHNKRTCFVLLNKCENCGQLGHNKRTCYFPPKNTPSNPKRLDSSVSTQPRQLGHNKRTCSVPQYKCANCRQLGHNKRTCFVPPNDTPSNP